MNTGEKSYRYFLTRMTLALFEARAFTQSVCIFWGQCRWLSRSCERSHGHTPRESTALTKSKLISIPLSSQTMNQTINEQSTEGPTRNEGTFFTETDCGFQSRLQRDFQSHRRHCGISARTIWGGPRSCNWLTSSTWKFRKWQ